MKPYSTSTLIGVGLTTFVFAFLAFARNHSALNGTWTLVPARSEFAGQPVVQTGTVAIDEQQGGIIVVSRNFVYEGATETSFYSDSTGNDHAGSQNNSTVHTGTDLQTKTRWDHNVLVVTTTQSGARTLESYTLAPDGTMTVRVVRPEHEPITLVFRRK